MKKILALFGKGLAVILYWTLFAMLVWLFYDEYITGQKWSSICLCIAFGSAGCAFHGVFVNWVYGTELKRFEQVHKKVYDVIVKIVTVISFIFLGIFVLSFLAGILGDFSYICISGVIMLICRTWKFWLLILFLFVISLILKAFRQPVVRVMSKFMYRLSLLSSIALIVYIEVDTWNLSGMDTFVHDCLIAGGVIFIFFCSYLLYLFYNSVEKGILSFARNRYLLFLRAFKDDDDLMPLYNEISSSIDGIPLIKIGDPEKSDNGNINEHHLPLSNWKFFLRYYISRAKAIVTVVSSTDGLIWEVAQNAKYLNKSIIVFNSTKELAEFEVKLFSSKNGHLDAMIYAIEKVISNWHYGNAFIVRGSKIYIGSACNLVNLVIKNDFNGIEQIDMPDIDSVKTRVRRRHAINDFLFKHFHILGLVNSIESIHNGIFRTSLVCLLVLIAAIFYVAQLLIGVGLLLWPLFIWFGIGYEGLGTSEKVFMSWIALSFGIGIIKNIFSKD